MTDKPGEPLNLIERMAKRLAAEDAAATNAAQPKVAGLVERAAQKVASLPAASSKPPDIRGGERTEHLGQKTSSPSLAAHVPSSEPTSSPGIALANPNRVRLDFRALRQKGVVTPDNM